MVCESDRLQLWSGLGWAGKQSVSQSVSQSGLLCRQQLLIPLLLATFLPPQIQPTDQELLSLLEEVHLSHLPRRSGGLDAELDWAGVLSQGERAPWWCTHAGSRQHDELLGVCLGSGRWT